MFRKSFWVAAAERGARAFAAAVISLWAVGDGILDVFAVDWQRAGGVGLGAAVVSLLVSIAAGAGIGPTGSPSLVPDPAAAGELPPR